jgi:hypothetical protein
MVKKLIVAISIILSACAYDASYGDCAVHCTNDSGCPDGLTCAPEGLCRAAEAEVCVLPSDGTGGTITHVGGRTIHTFSASQSGSTFTPPAVTDVELLVVAGGGGGGSTRGGGGGGAGGLVHVTTYTITQPSYVVMVGYGGAPSTNGGNSSFATITTLGGGTGRASSTPNGGSGGGASHDTNDGPAGTGTTGQGHRGGLVGYNSGSMAFTGAGGGGAGGDGADGTASAGGTGGPGLTYSISGELEYYAGGGGGGDQDLGAHGLTAGTGGSGGGGRGGLNAIGNDGLDGIGGGGGGGGAFLNGGRGGTGIVIVSYQTSW